MAHNFNKQRGASFLEYALLASVISMTSLAAVKYLGKETKRPSCLVIGALVAPNFYGTGDAWTKWKSDTQQCQQSDGWGGYDTIF